MSEDKLIGEDGPQEIWVFLDQGTNVTGYSETGPELARRNERAVHFTRTPQWRTLDSIPNGLLALFCDMEAVELRNSFFVDWMVDGKFCGNRHHTATHWMPLPEAPNVQK